jgi:hypothetical protein
MGGPVVGPSATLTLGAFLFLGDKAMSKKASTKKTGNEESLDCEIRLRKQLQDAYATAFSGSAGKMVLYDLAQASHFLFPSFLDTQRHLVTPTETVINEGARRLFLRILRFSGKERAMWELLGEHAMFAEISQPAPKKHKRHLKTVPISRKEGAHGNDL